MRHEINKCLWQIKHLNSTCTWHESMNGFFWNSPRSCASIFTNNDMKYKGILKNIAHFFDLYNITIIVQLWTLYITINAKKDEHRHTTPDKNTPLRAILNIYVRTYSDLKILTKEYIILNVTFMSIIALQHTELKRVDIEIGSLKCLSIWKPAIHLGTPHRLPVWWVIVSCTERSVTTRACWVFMLVWAPDWALPW